jgi:TPR repeat protein
MISLEAAVALTELSRRTLWRRIAEGALHKIEAGEGAKGAKDKATHTHLVLSEVLELAGLVLDDERLTQLKMADHGDPAAQLEIGQYFYSIGRQALAVYWFHLASIRKDADAMHCLGQCYAMGTGIEKNEELAIMWIAKAAAQGHVIAQKQMQGLRK